VINSFLLTSSPGRSSKTVSICRARLPRGTGFSPSNRRNCVGRKRNGPNDVSVDAAEGSIRLADDPSKSGLVTARFAPGFGSERNCANAGVQGECRKAVVDPDARMVGSACVEKICPRPGLLGTV